MTEYPTHIHTHTQKRERKKLTNDGEHFCTKTMKKRIYTLIVTDDFPFFHHEMKFVDVFNLVVYQTYCVMFHLVDRISGTHTYTPSMRLVTILISF